VVKGVGTRPYSIRATCILPMKMMMAVNFKYRKNRLKIPVLIYRAIAKTKIRIADPVPTNTIWRADSTGVTKIHIPAVSNTNAVVHHPIKSLDEVNEH